jgi:hypothetical protein
MDATSDTQTTRRYGTGRRRRAALAAALSLALAAAASLGAVHTAHAGLSGGTGSTCTVSNVSVSINPAGSQENLYVYEVNCPGKPLGWFGGNATARYQVIGNWDPQSHIAHDNVFSFDRNQGVLDTWTCSDDPWITPAQDGNNNVPDGHTCQLQSQKGGDDWEDDTGGSFANDMCFNDPWGASLAGCWSNDDLSVAGPSAAIMLAYTNALAATGQKAPPPQQSQTGNPIPMPVHLPLPGNGVGNLTTITTPSPSPAPVRLPVSLPLPH